MVLLGKTLTALVTNVWPLPGMEFAVCHQVAFQWERPATFLANEWPLAAISNGTREEEKKTVRNGKIYSIRISLDECNNCLMCVIATAVSPPKLNVQMNIHI